MKCEFYRLHTQAARPAANIPESKTPWCAHPQSRASVFAVAGRMGGGRLLQCGGVESKCTLPAASRPKS